MHYHVLRHTVKATDFVQFLNETLDVIDETLSLNREKIMFIFDNSSVHKAKVSMKWMRRSQIRAMTIAPYSPELNFVELVFLIIKNKIL